MLALFTAVSRPSVHVDADAAGDELRGWLVVRLSEEGFELVPDGARAEVDLRVVREGDGWVVQADAEDAQTYRVADGPPALQRLEVLHRAVAAAEEVAPRIVLPSDTAAVPRVAIDVDPAAEIEARDRLAAQVTLAVLAAGARVVAPGEPHDRRVCAREDEGGVAMGAGEQSCATAELVALADAPQWIARAVTPDPKPEPAPAPAPAPEPEPAAAKPATPSPLEPKAPRAGADPDDRPPATEPSDRRKIVLRLGARGGLVARVRPVDGAATADVRLGRFAGPSAWLDVQVWPSSAAKGRLRIVEAVPALGLRWRFVVHDRVALDAGALVGVAVHAYALSGRRDVTADISGELAGAIGIRLVRSLQLEAELRGGLVGRDRRHEIGNVPVWERDAWRVAAFAGFSWGFDLRRRR